MGAGAGPGEGPLVIDIDSFVGEVYGYQKQGAGYGYTQKLGITRSRRSGRTPARCCTSATARARPTPTRDRPVRRRALARVRRAGHTGMTVIRADSGFENHKLFKELDARGIEFSIGVKLTKTIRALVEQIDETAWVMVADYPDGGEAQFAETELKGFRLIVSAPV